MRKTIKPNRVSRSKARTSSYRIERVILIMGVITMTCITILRTSQGDRRHLLSFREGLTNAIKVKVWRHKVVSSCKRATSEEEMKEVKQISREFTSSIHEKDSHSNKDLKPEFWMQKCPFVFLDLGAGVGDSVGEFIDSGLVGCRRSDDDTLGFDPMHFDTDSGRFKEIQGSRKDAKNQAFTDWVKKRIQKFYPGLGPEDYCVYGVEANPLLKADLMKLERHVVRQSTVILCFHNFVL